MTVTVKQRETDATTGASRASVASGGDPENDIGSARRLLRLLTSFNATEPYATAEQLARRNGLPLSSTYRYLSMLREVGLVEERGRTGFQVGPVSIRLAQAARAANPIEYIAKPYLTELSHAEQETVTLLRRANGEAICIDFSEPNCIVRPSVKIGAATPLHIGAAPKVLLATLPGAIRTQVVQQIAVRYNLDERHVDALQTELQIIDDRGWAECYGGAYPDVFAVSAPVRDGERVVAAVAIVAPIFRVSPERSQVWRAVLIETCEKISHAFSAKESESE